MPLSLHYYQTEEILLKQLGTLSLLLKLIHNEPNVDMVKYQIGHY
jgi:hypothetical protein